MYYAAVGVADQCRLFCERYEVNPQTLSELLTFFRQEGLGQLASKFGTSPAELLKEEETWASGVQQVRKHS